MALHLHIDPFSGIAGDMFLGALIDLGVDLDAIRAALAPLGVIEPERLSAKPTTRRGIAAMDFRVDVKPATGHHHHHADDEHAHAHDEGQPDHHHHDQAETHHHQGDGEHHHHHHGESGHTHSHRHGNDSHHRHGGGHGHGEHGHGEHRGYRDLMALVERLDTTERGRARAGSVVTKLAEAEAAVHAMPLERVHFHEVGAVDSIVDLMGAAVGLELLGDSGVETLSCGPLPISRGYVRCDHGLMPVPAPATMKLLRGLPTVGVNRTGELVTPTGAALVAGLCTAFGPPPAMTLHEVGHGAGDRDDPDVPNVLRLLLGERTEASATGHHGHGHHHHAPHHPETAPPVEA